MKKILNFVLLGLLLFPACRNNEQQEATTENEPETLVEETEMDEIPNGSDLDMDEAMEAFLAGDKEDAADYIQYAAADLEEEGEDLTGNHKALLEMAIGNLNNLAEKVKKGEVKDEKELGKVFANAEMNVAHAYLTFTDVYVVDAPEKAKDKLEKAIAKMEHAATKLEGRAKTDAEDMIKEGQSFLKREDTKADEWGNAVGRQIEKMTGWLEMHG